MHALAKRLVEFHPPAMITQATHYGAPQVVGQPLADNLKATAQFTGPHFVINMENPVED